MLSECKPMRCLCVLSALAGTNLDSFLTFTPCHAAWLRSQWGLLCFPAHVPTTGQYENFPKLCPCSSSRGSSASLMPVFLPTAPPLPHPFKLYSPNFLYTYTQSETPSSPLCQGCFYPQGLFCWLKYPSLCSAVLLIPASFWIKVLFFVPEGICMYLCCCSRCNILSCVLSVLPTVLWGFWGYHSRSSLSTTSYGWNKASTKTIQWIQLF